LKWATEGSTQTVAADVKADLERRLADLETMRDIAESAVLDWVQRTRLR
jgi:hypothetical protein